MSKKYKKRRWVIKVGDKYYNRDTFPSKGAAQAFLRSIGLPDSMHGKFEFKKINMA